ncbi:DNA-binding protein [Parafrigoribacterium soli]|uniref:DNA-binding protein n=1 Tax=Parafrigoribacterium soli TaxID=3144663 RepID=UPI0032F07366
MLVITADQIQSRSTEDRAGLVLDDLNARFGDRLTLPVDRNAGDEIQVIAPDGDVALQIILGLTRSGHWSVGLGAGEIRTPLPRATREASGSAFIAARAAIGRAKKRGTHFAAEEARDDGGSRATTAAEAEALIDLLLVLRSRRTTEGWELFDRTARGLNQRDAARELKITPQAVSSRGKIAAIRTELASYTALARVLDNLDADQGSEHGA